MKRMSVAEMVAALARYEVTVTVTMTVPRSALDTGFKGDPKALANGLVGRLFELDEPETGGVVQPEVTRVTVDGAEVDLNDEPTNGAGAVADGTEPNPAENGKATGKAKVKA